MKTVKPAIILFSLFLIASTPCLALDPEAIREAAMVPERAPGGSNTAFVPARSRTATDPDWIVRTGYKKGIIDHLLPEERRAGPDAAILKSGFFEHWEPLLAEFREPSILIEPADIAGIENTKPFLVIPSGALAGLSDSEFFRIGLAEYVRHGGVILCFAQQNGADLAALPVPAGSKIAAKGWAQDSGPLFRSVAVQGSHPVLSNMQPGPSVETDGYLTSYPVNTRILLSRTDGFPALIIYPFGKGFVAVTTLYSDVAYHQGVLDPEEKVLLRDIVSWAKSSGRLKSVTPGEQFSVPLAIRTAEQSNPVWIRAAVLGPGQLKPYAEQTIKLSGAAAGAAASGQVRGTPGEEHVVPFTYTVPADAKPGIYRIQYLLTDGAGKEITPLVESGSGIFAVEQASHEPAPLRRSRPQAHANGPIRISTSVDRSNGNFKIGFTITPELDTPAPEDYIARVAGQEKSFKISQGIVYLSFELAEQQAADRIPYRIYRADGRIAARGSIPGTGLPGMVSADSAVHLPGDKVRIRIAGLGQGEARLTGFGQSVQQMVSGTGNMELNIPPGISAGTYRLKWEFRRMDSSTEQGELPIEVTGNRLAIRSVSLTKRGAGKSFAVQLGFVVQSPRKITGTLKMYLRGPDGKTTFIKETALSVKEGYQDISAAFTFKPVDAGIHELIYAMHAGPSENSGASAPAGVIDRGRKLFDIGDAAVLGIIPEKPVYYETGGPVTMTVLNYCADNARIRIEIDGKKVKREKMIVAGPCEISVRIPSLTQGSHTLRATIEGEQLESSREYTFLYGALLPDLVLQLKSPQLTGMMTPVPIIVGNEGKTSSGPVQVALYDGDPGKKGVLIGKADVPAVTPGFRHIATINLPLAGKAGPRVLYAVADPDDRAPESNKTNNTAFVELVIPDLILKLSPGKQQFSADEKITFSMLLANLTSAESASAALDIKLLGPAGAVLASESMTFPALAPGAEQTVSRELSLASPPVSGTYQITADTAGTMPGASVKSGITVLPTISLAGSLEGTPGTAAVCKPFTIRFNVNASGNIPVSSGLAMIEILSAGAREPAYTRQFNLNDSIKPLTIDRLDLPPGQYSIALKANASNRQFAVKRELTIAEQPLTVLRPIEAKKSELVLPRVLVLTGHTETEVRKAMLENILKQIFDQQVMYHKVTPDAQEFMKEAMSGMFNIFVLFEQDELLPALGWVQDAVKRGNGLVIIGEGEKSRATAESFGFRFKEPLPEEVRMLSIRSESGLAISGTLPVCGRILPPEKKGTQPVALVGEETVAVMDKYGEGAILILPFSVIRSSIDTGASPLYSALLCSAFPSVLPERNEPGGIASIEINFSSPAGPIKSKFIEILPAGSELFWTHPEVKPGGNTITFETTADREIGKFIYMYRPPAQGENKTGSEIFYECKGDFVSQGKME